MNDDLRTWVLSYDVADDKRRTRLHRALQSRGQRVQFSVFEVLATGAELDALLAAITHPSRFDATTDSVRAWPLCERCQPSARVVGAGPPVSLPGRPLIL